MIDDPWWFISVLFSHFSIPILHDTSHGASQGGEASEHRKSGGYLPKPKRRNKDNNEITIFHRKINYKLPFSIVIWCYISLPDGSIEMDVWKMDANSGFALLYVEFIHIEDHRSHRDLQVTKKKHTTTLYTPFFEFWRKLFRITSSHDYNYVYMIHDSYCPYAASRKTYDTPGTQEDPWRVRQGLPFWSIFACSGGEWPKWTPQLDFANSEPSPRR